MAKEKDDEDGNSVFHHLLRSDLPDSEKSTSRLNSEAFSLLGAGTMSTTSALTVISYHVLANHEIQKQLSQELKDVMKDYPDTPPSWADLEKLPFLTGCVKEGLRSVVLVITVCEQMGLNHDLQTWTLLQTPHSHFAGRRFAVPRLDHTQERRLQRTCFRINMCQS